MARISGVNVPVGKRVEIGLTYIFGIGRSTAQKILEEAKVDPNTMVKDLTEDEVIRLRDAVDQRERRKRTISSGRTGVALISMPNGARASHTALAIATGGATAPPSPTPLTPSGFNGEGEC